MSHGSGSYPNVGPYGPPPSSTGYHNVGRNLPPPPTGADNVKSGNLNYPAGGGSTGVSTYYGAPASSAYGASTLSIRNPSLSQPGDGINAPPLAQPPNSASRYAPPPSSQANQPVSQAELLKGLGQSVTPSLSNLNPTNMPTTYRAYAPPPLATSNNGFSGYGGGLDSKGSISNNRHSGNYNAAFQHYPSGTPGTAYPRGFTAATPGRGGSSSNLHSYAGSPATSPSAANRIDPSQMPRPDKPLVDVVFHTKSGSGRRNPPSCNSMYTAIDTGNCIPRHMRCTLVAPPSTKAVLEKTGLPFALLASPFADPQHGEKAVPEVDLGPVPPRCSRCRAYVNSSVAWMENGNAWQCNLCSMVNDTPPWYYCSLDGQGQRMDRSSRPELSLGSVDFLVNEDYCLRPIQEPIYVFALDVSHKAAANGVTMAGLRAIRGALQRLRQLETRFRSPSQPSTQTCATAAAAHAAYVKPSAAAAPGRRAAAGGAGASGEEKRQCRIRAAIVTFDKDVQFYTVNMASVDPVKMLVVSAHDPVCPLPVAKWLLEVTNDASALEHLLQRIPELVASMQESQGAMDAEASSAPTVPNGSRVGDMRSYSSFSQVLGSAGSTPRSPRPGAGTGNTPRGRPLSGTGYDVAAAALGPECAPCSVAAAIKSIQEGLDAVGGRLLVVSASHATVGFGALPRGRERINLYGTKDEINLYGYAEAVINGPAVGVKEAAASAISTAATAIGAATGSAATATQSSKAADTEDLKKICAVYRDLATSCARSYVTLSLLACVGDDCLDGGPFFDTALLGEVVTRTGGQLHFVTGALMHEDNVLRLEQQLVADIQDVRASEAVAKLRTSVGLRVDRVISPGSHNAIEAEVELCGVDRHSSLMFTICHDSALKEDERAHFQLALLHTTPDRRRVIRVHNLSCIATPKPTVVFRNCDTETVLACMVKEAADRALTRPLSEEGHGARYCLDNAIATPLHRYRTHCSPSSPSGQLVLPDSMKMMPVFVLGMLKHPAFMENRSALGTVSSAAAVSNTQSLLTNASSGAGLGGIGMAGGSGSNLSKLAFIPSYESALSRVAVRAHERAYELRRLLGAPLVEVTNSMYPRLYKLSTLFDDMADLGFSQSADDDQERRPSGEAVEGSHDSIDVSDEYINTSAGSVSFNNLLGRHAAGLQIELPSPGTGAGMGTMLQLSASTEAAQQLHSQLTAKALCTLCPSAEVFESDQIYLLDDRSCLYMFVGRSVPRAIVDEILETTPGVGGLGRKDSVSFRTATSELARRMAAFVEVLRGQGAHRQELRVVWGELSGNNPLMGKFSSRLIEDGNGGLMSYVDYLCNLHLKIQSKTK